MFICIFIDWENIEKTVKQNYGSIIDFDKFIKVIRDVAASRGSRLVGIQAYGDFDKGTAGLMSRLVNLGVEPHHVVTKTAQDYLKGSTDIELSLDILETMYNFPHITEFLFISGDSDLRHVIKRLQKQGKCVKIMGFKNSTSQFLIDMVNEFITLDKYPEIMRKVTLSEKEQAAKALISNKFIKIILLQLDGLEKSNEKEFVGLNFFRNKLIDYYKSDLTSISDALTDCIDNDLLIIYQVDNPNDIKHPTRACKLNRDNNIVKYLLSENPNI